MNGVFIMEFTIHPNPHLKQIGSINDTKICLATTAIALSDNPYANTQFFTDFLAELSSAVSAYYLGFAGGDPSTDFYGRAKQHDIIKKLSAIKAVVFDQYQFYAERTHNSPSEKSDFCFMLEKRKGTPINLAILCMHLARAQGWEAEGIAIPGHFVCRLGSHGERIIFDPFNRAKALNASDLRSLVKQTLGATAELQQAHYRSVENRSILLKLQNNVKLQQEHKKNFRAALIAVNTMQQIAPKEPHFLYDAGLLYARANQAKTAITVLKRYIQSSSSSCYRKNSANHVLRLLMQQR
tara:strand:- start:1868 stop:2755 length:888 start_codon:yes stop_codon:yes gene_type:complete